MLKINVLIITYKQEKLISRALDSILCQKEWGLNKIVICDDNSPDNNWEVIQDYYARYPHIICAYRNSENIGIYRNAEKRIALRGQADLYIRMAGDDAICDGYLESLQKFCEDKSDVIRGHSVAIYSDWKNVCPDGTEILRSNSAIANSSSPVSLKIRGMICNRSVAVSELLLSRFQPIDQSKGLSWAETQFDLQTQTMSDINYYCSCVGSIYYSGIGISTKMQTLHYYKENILKYSLMLEHYELSSKDREYVKYHMFYYKYIVYRKLSCLFKSRLAYWKSLDSLLEYRLLPSIKSIYRMIKTAYTTN